MATTTVADRVINVVQSCFAKLGGKTGMAEGALGMPASCSVISGVDPRRGGAPYIDQLTVGGLGGPGVHGRDGWMTYGIPVTGGVLHGDSMEVDEQRLPISSRRHELIPDSGGAGEWRGAPGSSAGSGSAWLPGPGYIPATATSTRPRGWPAACRAGSPTSGNTARRLRRGGTCPRFPRRSFSPERFWSPSPAAAAGTAIPLDRDPEKVGWDVREGFVSLESARDVYGVVIDAGPELSRSTTKPLRGSSFAEEEGRGGEMSYRMSVDIGGTFTDLVVVDEEGRIRVFKSSTTPEDYVAAVIGDLRQASESFGISLEGLMQECSSFIGGSLVHGSTIATNALIEKKLAKTGLICTRGFRDVLTDREGGKAEPFNWDQDYPPAYVPRYLTCP